MGEGAIVVDKRHGSQLRTLNKQDFLSKAPLYILEAAMNGWCVLLQHAKPSLAPVLGNGRRP